MLAQVLKYLTSSPLTPLEDDDMNTDLLKETLRRLHNDESGATATEYIILLVLVACVIIAVVRTFGVTVEHKYADANNAVDRDLTF